MDSHPNYYANKTLWPMEFCRNSHFVRLQLKQNEIDVRVALAGVAQLHCKCGIIGVVRAEDIGNGIIVCPSCKNSYCVKCGNFSHGKAPCPPPADTLRWMKKHAKPCPNCGHMIQKNGGKKLRIQDLANITCSLQIISSISLDASIFFHRMRPHDMSEVGGRLRLRDLVYLWV